MKKYTGPLIAFCCLLLSGCTTTQHASQWEYKVAEPTGGQKNTRTVIEPFLNEMGKDGWVLIEKDETGWFYFKREKR